MRAGGRIFGLDVLRAAAILGVFLAHELNVWIAGVNVLGELGSGVFLFFVLSGFLIGGICFRSLRNDKFSIWEFWRSRWWRTLPPYVAAIFLYLAVRPFHPQFPPLPLNYALFLQNYLGQPGLEVTWSLCVEEHFYLCLPIVIFLAVRFAGRSALGVVLPVLFFVPLALRLSTYWIEGAMPIQWYRMTHLTFDYLIVGVWLSYLLEFDRPAIDRLKRPSRWLLAVLVVNIVVLPWWNSRSMLFDLFFPSLLALGLGALLLQIHDLRWEPVSRIGRLIRWCVVGTALCSYSIYLTHTTLDPLMRAHLQSVLTRGPIRSVIVLSVTWFGGVMFYLLIERPTIISRDRYLKRLKVPTLQIPLQQKADAA
jgi:peptidoglycan/LPS O-acetylase OafA/YrhL